MSCVIVVLHVTGVVPNIGESGSMDTGNVMVVMAMVVEVMVVMVVDVACG